MRSRELALRYLRDSALFPPEPLNVAGISYAPGAGNGQMASGLDQPLIAFDTNTLIAQTALPSSFITAPDIHTALVTGVSQIGHGALGVVDATVDAAVGTVSMLGNLSLAALNDQTQGYLGSKFEMFRNADRTRSQLQQGIATTIANPQGAMTSMFEHLAERERQAQWHEANGNLAAAARIRGGYASSIASGAMGGAGVVRGIARYSDVVAGGGRVAVNRGGSYVYRQVDAPTTDIFSSYRAGSANGAVPEGVVYLRTDRTGGILPYGGQAKSEARFFERQTEHARAHPDADFEFTIVRRAEPGVQLDIAEHNFIQQLTGGVAARKSPLVSNLKDPVGAARRAELGLPEPRRNP
jgi:hypothetical protein